MAQSDELEALAKRHGALSYRNRADTQNPAFGFSAVGLASLIAEARRDALEKAETACAEISVDYWMGDAQFEAATRCRNAIRKLKEDTQ
jgi:hypothetical protein